MKCCVCKGDIQEHSHNGKVYWTEGHNAQPLVDGRCCDDCNNYVVGFRIFCFTNQSLNKEEWGIQKLRYIQAAVQEQLIRSKEEEE
jgi:hypothetical protein